MLAIKMDDGDIIRGHKVDFSGELFFVDDIWEGCIECIVDITDEPESEDD